MCDWEISWVSRFVGRSVKFQSLKGIMCDWEGVASIRSGGTDWFQSLKGIMCDWEPIIENPTAEELSFNPWKGLCVIERVISKRSSPLALVSIPERDYVWLRDFRFPAHVPCCLCFNPWKGLCVIERKALDRYLSYLVVSIPERDYVWLRGEDEQGAELFSSFQSLKGIMCDWEAMPSTTTTQLKCFNPWKGLCVIESSQYPGLQEEPTRFNPWKGLCVIESDIAHFWKV